MKFMKLGSKPDSFRTDGQVRFVATELATDIIINVGDVKFYLHKFPLLSKSSRLRKLVTTTEDETHDEIHISDIPGGASAFQMCAKFCYGMTVTLNAYNVIKARCAAEYLDMSEAAERGNLVYKIEVFLASSIFQSWKDSIVVLQTTKSVLPWSEDLKIVGHCIDAVAARASVEAPNVDWSYTYNRRKLLDENGVRKQQPVPKDWWVEDLCGLELDLFKRVVVAIGTKGRVSGKVIGEALRAYTYRRFPGFGKGSSVERGDDVTRRCRTLLETVVRLLPEEKGSVSCSFMLKLLRTGNVIGCNVTCRRDLAKRVGRQLEEAKVQDLLMPAPAGEMTLHDIDTVSAIVEEFVTLESRGSDAKATEEAVAKLVDGYLAEVATDTNLPLSKFLHLAEMVSGDSRPVHDGIYRAVDVYLKEHPNLSKSERKKLCGLMDCRKLSADACSHAVQNERLPLRVVVQVLFSEKARATAAAGGSTGADASSGVSYGSSMSVATTTTTEDNWDVPTLPTVEDLQSLESVKLAEGADEKGNAKVRRSTIMPKKMFGKLLSNKGHGTSHEERNSSSCTSSTNQDEPKSTPSRNARLSFSLS